MLSASYRSIQVEWWGASSICGSWTSACDLVDCPWVCYSFPWDASMLVVGMEDLGFPAMGRPT
jgi:hypothetical protein